MLLRTLVSILFLSKICAAANILAVFTFPGFSHFQMFGPLLRELANRGHNVDVVSHFPLESPIERYNDISIRGSSPMFTNNSTVEALRELPGVGFTKFIAVTGGTVICENSFKAPELQQLKQSNKKYDAFITELFGSDCMLGWAWHFGAPSIVMTSSVNLPWAAERFGLPDNPSYVSNYLVGYSGRMSLYERIVNTWTLVVAKIMYKIYSHDSSNRMTKEFFGENTPDLEVLVQNTSLQLINTHFSINSARPLVPNVIEVAGLHIRKPKRVNEHFNMLLTTNKQGIIYFTMGSVLLTESLPNTTLQAMFDAFSELPYEVLWKAKKENLPKGLRIPNNINFEPWMPQLDILCNPRVKLFVSHGGMMGTQEAVHCGVPILGIPIFSDQSLNVKEAEAMGYALMVRYEDISKDVLLAAATKLLNDPTYAINAKRISEEFKDRPRSTMDTAVYWIEYVIRHKGAKTNIRLVQALMKNMHFNMLLTTNKQGIIYFTMGSVLLTESLPNTTLQAMFDAFSELPYEVLWKAKKENLPKGLRIPNNINFEPWMPQLDILCNPRVKLFVSHGGMMGTQEAVHCGVPILGIPIFSDQSLNVKEAEAMGYALMVRYEDISKDVLLAAATKLLNDPTYAINAKRISEEFKDRPRSTMDTAVYWIEYVIRHKGAPRLQSPAKYLSWYQYYLIDVITVILVAPLMLMYLFMKLVSFLIRSANRRTKTKLKIK